MKAVPVGVLRNQLRRKRSEQISPFFASSGSSSSGGGGGGGYT